MILNLEDTKTLLEITDNKNDLLLQIMLDATEEFIYLYTNNNFTENNKPAGLKLIQLQMIDFLTNHSVGVKSESISRQSLSFETLQDAFPSEIMSKLCIYCRVGW